MFGLIIATLSISHTDTFQLLVTMLLASLPAFLSGTFEDLSKRIGPLVRLWAVFACGIMGWWLTGYVLTRVDIWGGVDWLLQWLPLAVFFTAFAVAGVANAINMIDGLNGLAGGVMLLAMVALSTIAYQASDMTLVTICLLLGATMLGVLILNFPLGKLFLGDGGAYLSGFMGAWLAVMLPMRNPSVSVWAPLLVFSYPILELFSIYRPRSRAHHSFHPDRLHLHSLIYTRFFKSFTYGWSKPQQNSFASLLPLCFMALASTLAVLFAHSTQVLMACLILMAVLYALVYTFIIRFRHFRRVTYTERSI